MTTTIETAPNRSTARRWATTAMIAALAGGLLTGCATASGDDTDPTGGNGRGNAFAACMRDKGHDIADPSGDSVQLQVPDGVDPAQYERDSAACGEKTSGAGAGKAEELPGAAEFNRKLAACLREDGFADYPDDPTVSYEPTDEAAFEKSYDACSTEIDASMGTKVG